MQKRSGCRRDEAIKQIWRATGPRAGNAGVGRRRQAADLTGKKAWAVAAITTALGVLFASSASATDRDNDRGREHAVSRPVLEGARIDAVGCQSLTSRVAQHVHMDREGEANGHAKAFHYPLRGIDR
jgi:hypothetical protein